MTLVAAYGRNYHTSAQAISDFNDGKDFFSQGIHGSCYCTKSELIENGIKSVAIRYDLNRKVVVVYL